MTGAAVPNAVQAAVQLAATLHTYDGRVAVRGFYDAVQELSATDRAEIRAVPHHQQEYLADIGATDFTFRSSDTSVRSVWLKTFPKIGRH